MNNQSLVGDNRPTAQCEEMAEWYSLHLDDELDDITTVRLRRHEATCPHCMTLFAKLKKVDHMFQHAPMKYAPLGFTDKVVSAAFEQELRRNLSWGFLILMLGTVVVIGLMVLGRIDMLWAAISFLMTPGLGGSEVWLAETIQALTVVGQVMLGVLELLRNLLIGPLLIPALMSLLGGAFIILFLRRQGTGAVSLSS